MSERLSFRRWISVSLTIITILAISAGLKASQRGDPKLPVDAKRWLEDEVSPIIAPAEREVFSKLLTDRERQLFIQAFWRHRDPTPGTSENEFRTEHYRRLAYADQYLGRDAVRPGRRTDRGRIYIILGPPNDIQRFEGRTATYDSEIWFYQGRLDLGLPAGFNIVFFREGGRGEYRLYSPLGDGPQKLLVGNAGGSDYDEAFRALQKIEPGLAAVSLSLIPGESGTVSGRPSMSAEILLQKIQSSGPRSVETGYARKFLQYKDIIEVEYTANYLESDSLVKIFREPTGYYFVHYAVELQQLTMTEYDGRFSTRLRVNGRVTTPDGLLVHQFDKNVEVSLNAQQMSGVRRMPFDFQDLFPLVPGDYVLSVLIKNEASKEFTSIERSIRIPQAGTGVEMTQPLLGYRAVRMDAKDRAIRAFRIGAHQIYCQPSRVFTQKDSLAVVFQLNNLSPEMARDCEVRIELLKDGLPLRDVRRKPSELPELPDVHEEFILADLPPAHYAVRVTISRSGAEIVSASDEFDLSFAESVARPWFSSWVLPGVSDTSYDEIIGSQLANVGRFNEARILLERAFANRKDSLEVAAGLASVYLALDEPSIAARILEPFVAPSKTATYEAYTLAATACRRSGQPERALSLLDRITSLYGVNTALMNMIGECYEDMGKIDDALAAYGKSLQLSPDQPLIRKKAEDLKKRDMRST